MNRKVKCGSIIPPPYESPVGRLSEIRVGRRGLNLILVEAEIISPSRSGRKKFYAPSTLLETGARFSAFISVFGGHSVSPLFLSFTPNHSCCPPLVWETSSFFRPFIPSAPLKSFSRIRVSRRLKHRPPFLFQIHLTRSPEASGFPSAPSQRVTFPLISSPP